MQACRLLKHKRPEIFFELNRKDHYIQGSSGIATPTPWDADHPRKESLFSLTNFTKIPKCKHQRGSVNTMTENTKTLSIRLEIKDKEELGKYLNRESAEAILKQIRKKEIVLTKKGVEFIGVDTISESVNTCEDCPYMNDLNMRGFEEVCDYKGIDRQKALDKCVQMLWR